MEWDTNAYPLQPSLTLIQTFLIVLPAVVLGKISFEEKEKKKYDAVPILC